MIERAALAGEDGATVKDQSETALRGVSVSGSDLGQAMPRHRQDRLVSGRTVPQGRLHRHQPTHGAGRDHPPLQSPRYLRAAHQGMQVCLSLDAAVMLEVLRQRGPLRLCALAYKLATFLRCI